MSEVDWQLFGAAAYADDGKPDHDILRSFRDAAYAGGIPWNLGPTQINAFTIKALLRSMARTFDDGRQLSRLFVFMDETRQHGWPSATIDAGDILIARAEGKRKTLPLPHDWADRARVAASRGKNSSGAYWAGAMLRAAGLHSPGGRDRDDPGERGVG